MKQCTPGKRDPYQTYILLSSQAVFARPQLDLGRVIATDR